MKQHGPGVDIASRKNAASANEHALPPKVVHALEQAGITEQEIREATRQRMAEKQRKRIAVKERMEAQEARGPILFPTGEMMPRQMLAMFTTLELDLTFVDAQDRVQFYNEGPGRIFARSKSALGRKVHDCHPAKTHDVLNHILNALRTGEENVFEFRQTVRDQHVLIRYIAVRDGETGRYLGCLEVAHDLTDLVESAARAKSE